MAYMTDIGEILAKQLTKFATLHRHQFAGQAANLAFWSDELQHCLDVIGSYEVRFNRMRAAQMKCAAAHEIEEFALDDPCCCRGNASLPRRIGYRELDAAKQSLCDAMRRFLARCRKESLINEIDFQDTLTRFRIPLEAADADR
jgi:hypothetical protein